LRVPIVEHVKTVQAPLQEIEKKKKPAETPIARPGEKEVTPCSGNRVEFKLSNGKAVCV